jgi:hypothetical protein
MTEERVLNAISAEGLEPSPTSLAEFYRRKTTGAAAAKDISPVANTI